MYRRRSTRGFRYYKGASRGGRGRGGTYENPFFSRKTSCGIRLDDALCIARHAVCVGDEITACQFVWQIASVGDKGVVMAWKQLLYYSLEHLSCYSTALAITDKIIEMSKITDFDIHASELKAWTIMLCRHQKSNVALWLTYKVEAMYTDGEISSELTLNEAIKEKKEVDFAYRALEYFNENEEFKIWAVINDGSERIRSLFDDRSRKIATIWCAWILNKLHSQLTVGAITLPERDELEKIKIPLPDRINPDYLDMNTASGKKIGYSWIHLFTQFSKIKPRVLKYPEPYEEEIKALFTSREAKTKEDKGDVSEW